MNITDLRGKTDDELKTILANSRKEAFNLRFQRSGGIVEKTNRIREVRKTIARVQTLLNQTLEQRTAAPSSRRSEAKADKAKPVKKAAEKKEPAKKAEKKPAAKKKTA